MSSGEQKPVAATPRKDATTTTGFGAFANLRREIDTLFDDFKWGSWRTPSQSASSDVGTSRHDEISWSRVPAVDIVDGEESYDITAELPGIDETHIEVKVTNGTLTIKGEKEEAADDRDKKHRLTERRYGFFQRSFAIPEGVNAEKIAASFENGVLMVSLPKVRGAQRRGKRIDVT